MFVGTEIWLEGRTCFSMHESLASIPSIKRKNENQDDFRLFFWGWQSPSGLLLYVSWTGRRLVGCHLDAGTPLLCGGQPANSWLRRSSHRNYSGYSKHPGSMLQSSTASQWRSPRSTALWTGNLAHSSMIKHKPVLKTIYSLKDMDTKEMVRKYTIL